MTTLWSTSQREEVQANVNKLYNEDERMPLPEHEHWFLVDARAGMMQAYLSSASAPHPGQMITLRSSTTAMKLLLLKLKLTLTLKMKMKLRLKMTMRRRIKST